MKSTTTNKKHLTQEERVTIQTLLGTNTPAFKIAKVLGKSPSTITREINNHSKVIKEQSKCLHYSFCNKKRICPATFCTQYCKNCNSKNCNALCSHFEERVCIKGNGFRICNECPEFKHCTLEKRVYRAIEAEEEYRKSLTERRIGFDLNDEEINKLDSLVTPLIKCGHSPYSVVQTLGTDLPCSESTLYRLIDASYFEARNIDLPEKVKRKPRKHSKVRNKDVYTSMMKAKEQHTWDKYLEYLETHLPCPQMDCVEGKQEENATLLTLHWPREHMQLYFIMSKQTSANVVATLDKIEEAIGTELFMEMFPAILTDNGIEFTDINGMERSYYNPSIKRTHIYFCEPNRSDEKGAAERNHRLLRAILPKGSSLEPLTQKEATIITNHVNSYVRRSLGGKSPYDMAIEAYSEDFFINLGLERIDSSQVVLSPKLLISLNSSRKMQNNLFSN